MAHWGWESIGQRSTVHCVVDSLDIVPATLACGPQGFSWMHSPRSFAIALSKSRQSALVGACDAVEFLPSLSKSLDLPSLLRLGLVTVTHSLCVPNWGAVRNWLSP